MCIALKAAMTMVPMPLNKPTEMNSSKRNDYMSLPVSFAYSFHYSGSCSECRRFYNLKLHVESVVQLPCVEA